MNSYSCFVQPWLQNNKPVVRGEPGTFIIEVKSVSWWECKTHIGDIKPWTTGNMKLGKNSRKHKKFIANISPLCQLKKGKGMNFVIFRHPSP